MTGSEPQPHGLLIVVSGPSGVGKTTIVHALLERFGAEFSVSMTTRDKTDADTEGEDYFFVDEQRFGDAISGGELLEWAKVFGRFYGTPRGPVDQKLAAGKDVVLEIDVNGGVQVKKAKPEAVALFIMPPSEQTLITRLRDRGREDEAEIQRRFGEAKQEINLAQTCGCYDHFIVNDDLERAIGEAESLIRAAREAR